jgi:tetratricopeptide (TPR) repeat protein
MTISLNSARSTRLVFSTLLLVLSFGVVSHRSLAKPPGTEIATPASETPQDICKKSIVDFNTVIKSDPQNSAVLTERATCFATLGNHQAAIVDLTEALKFDQTIQYGLRADSYMALNDYKNALVDFDQQINNRNADAAKISDPEQKKFALPTETDYVGRAQAHQALGNWKAAIADFDQVLKLNPDAGDAYYGRALAQRSLGQKQAALQDFKQAAERYSSGEIYDQIIQSIKELQ